jgi:hypothetical protein
LFERHFFLKNMIGDNGLGIISVDRERRKRGQGRSG